MTFFSSFYLLKNLKQSLNIIFLINKLLIILNISYYKISIYILYLLI